MRENPIRARRAEEKAQRRIDILDAAEAVITAHGPEAANFGEIAKRARLSRALLYTYFQDKDELFNALTRRGMDELHRRLLAAGATTNNGLEQAMAMGRAYHHFALEEPVYYQLVMELHVHESGHEPSDPEEDACMARGREIIGLLAEAIGRGVADGSVRASVGDLALTAISLWANTHGLIQLARRKEGMLVDRFGVSVDALMEHGFALMRASLARVPG